LVLEQRQLERRSTLESILATFGGKVLFAADGGADNAKTNKKAYKVSCTYTEVPFKKFSLEKTMCLYWTMIFMWSENEPT